MREKKRKTKNKRGRPATGQDPVTAIRLSQDMLEAVEVWGPLICSDCRNRSDYIRTIIASKLNPLIRKRQFLAKHHGRETHARLTAGGATFTAEKERALTETIKARMLYEGACDLPWPGYFAFRDKHDGCEPLNEGDLIYAAAYSSCPVPKARPKLKDGR